MIIGLIVLALLALVDGLVSFLPDVDLPDTFGETNPWLNAVLGMNAIIPVVALVKVIALALAVEVALRLWDLAVFVFHQFWGAS